MSLLQLEHVGKRAPDGGRVEVLRDVCLTIEEGELGVVWGLRRSGRSTLLRVAAGIETPEAGTVRFDGADLSRHGERLLGSEIGFCQKMLRFDEGQTAVEHAMVGLLSRWVTPRRARRAAEEALATVGAAHCAGLARHELSAAETVRVALARTLTLQPRLVIVDEPVKGVELHERDGVLRLLRELADEGIAVLASAGESTGLSEADRGFVLSGGELRGAAASPRENVVQLHAAPRSQRAQA